MNRLKTLALAPVLLALIFFADGCAARTRLIATDMLGKSANSAHDAMGEWLTVKAINALGTNATPETVEAWVHAKPEWQETKRLHTEFFEVYEVWIRANAAAASGNGQPPDFSLISSAANELFTYVGKFIPGVAGWKAQPPTR